MDNEELHNLYFCLDIIIIIEIWKTGYVGHVEHKGRCKTNTEYVGKSSSSNFYYVGAWFESRSGRRPP
jgi:hypothetical protein